LHIRLKAKGPLDPLDEAPKVTVLSKRDRQSVAEGGSADHGIS
jgi:hypothetical protein